MTININLSFYRLGREEKGGRERMEKEREKKKKTRQVVNKKAGWGSVARINWSRSLIGNRKFGLSREGKGTVVFHSS